MPTTLVAVSGMSPAILTEALWALADEETATVPDEVAFVTTVTGAARLEEQLFTPRPEWGSLTVYENLRASLGSADHQLIGAGTPQIFSINDGSADRAPHRSLTGHWDASNLTAYPTPALTFWFTTRFLAVIPVILIGLILVASATKQCRIQVGIEGLDNTMRDHLRQGTLGLHGKSSLPPLNAKPSSRNFRPPSANRTPASRFLMEFA
ncbi:MAG: hypothetical protein KA004_04880 [Verrucomicrobiales bacterium]|nr:hypothetical protein [Verrucomicrobiales bacterium]